MSLRALLTVKNLVYGYTPRFPILKKINFELHPGEIVLLTGANGSGKTTLIKVIAGLLRESSGEMTWGASGGGRSLFLPDSLLYHDLTLQENFRLYSALTKTPAAKLEKNIESLALKACLPLPFRTLSRGQKIRGALCRTFLSDVPLYLLDEPLTGLDAESIGRLQEVFASLAAQGKTVLMSAHESAEFASRRLHIEGGVLHQEEKC